MLKFYNSNMKEVYLPKDYGLHYGSYPLELSVSSIEYEKRGNKRVPTGRQASLRAFIISSNYTDMQMKIDRVFEFFRSLGEFYIASAHTPFKLLKVSVDQSYTIDYGNTVLTDFEIPLVVHKPYFKQSLHTTLDIDSEGVRWNDKWGYGMGLSSDKSEWKYRFKPIMTAKELSKSLFENGSIFLSNGQNADSNTQLGRLKNLYSVNKGQKYRIDLNETGGTINYIRIFHYDSNGNYIGNEGTANVNGNGSTSYEFTAQGNSIRLLLYANGDAQVNVGGIGATTRIYLYGYYEHSHQFSFLNAGTEEVKLIQQKESEIKVKINSPASWIEIYDGQQSFRLNRAVKAGDTLKIRGHKVIMNGQNVLQDTNRNFLTIKQGWNNWEVRGITDFEIDIDFKFLYD